MSLEEYKRKRRFEETPEPPPEVSAQSGHRFVVQCHRATRLHYDFRLEMDGVLKSWAVPKGPSLDPADKRLAMQVEDHPVSYFDFEGTIPKGNYGAGTVMVWDVGTWEPLSPVTVKGKYVPASDVEADAMLKKGDLKIRLHGKRLKGDFAIVHIRARRPGSKGNEWLLIKKQDDDVIEGYDIDKYDTSVLTKRTMDEISGDEKSKEWTSSPPVSRGKAKAAWVEEALAKAKNRSKPNAAASAKAASAVSKKKLSATAESSELNNSEEATSAKLAGARKAAMPSMIQPMLAESVDKPFDGPEWLFEIKWDGYRTIAFIHDSKVRLVSRKQNDFTAQFPDLQDMPQFIRAKTAVLDGEIVALDENGRSSFGLMQRRTGFRKLGKRVTAKHDVPILYYAFDLLYLDGYDLRKVALEQRKKNLAELISPSETLRYSEHFSQGLDLFNVAKAKGLEGILAKRRNSVYEEKRTRDWLKIKITQSVDCVIGGYTDPEGSRTNFGALVLGLYDKKGQLIHVGRAGSGFDQEGLGEMFQKLKKKTSKNNPFYGPVDVDARHVHWVKPELVAEIKFTDWTDETADGGKKLRAPVFMQLRDDKNPEECTFGE